MPSARTTVIQNGDVPVSLGRTCTLGVSRKVYFCIYYQRVARVVISNNYAEQLDELMP
jgi:hypothetical protein